MDVKMLKMSSQLT